MVAHVSTFSFKGIDIIDVEVQIHIANGIPAFNIVGLPDKAVGESKERIRAALNSIALSLPTKRITVNLAPADLVKEGSHYDLAIALGILICMDVVSESDIAPYIVAGELALDGTILHSNGILPLAMHASASNKGIICSKKNGSEARWAGELPILAPHSLIELLNHIKGKCPLAYPECVTVNDNQQIPDLKDVKGQQSAKRALEIAAAGNHNLLMVGPPGSGKSMLASRLPGIIPEMETQEILETSMISSAAGLLKNGTLSNTRPFRAPHHSCSMAAMVGGGKYAKPGEITLAHGGVLFLDELPEYNKTVLDSLRQPIETGNVTISRVNAHVTYPANFQLIAAMNPCRCGYLGDIERTCNKALLCGAQYQSKISGPMLDRFDITIDVPAVNILTLEMEPETEGSKEIRQRVITARQIQKERYHNTPIKTNSEADGELLLSSCNLSPNSKRFLQESAQKMNLSMRGYLRVLRVARTIADLSESTTVTDTHLKQALSYRLAS